MVLMKSIVATAVAFTAVMAAPAQKKAVVKRSFTAASRGRAHLHPLGEIARTHRKYGNYDWEIIVIDPEAANPSPSSSSSEPPTPYSIGSASESSPATFSFSPGTASYGAPSYGTAPPAHATTPSTPTYTNTSSLAAATGTTTGAEDGEVTATPEANEVEYLSPVTIGGQKLNLDFDTGSADLWVFSSKLSEQEIGKHAFYSPDNSTTWQALDGASWQISYGDGSSASGTVGYDSVDIGGSTVHKQAVEIATFVSQSFVQDPNSDGLLGLGFSSINTVQPQPQKTFFENVMDQLSEPVFTADLEETDGTGTYEFGSIDSAKYKGDIHWVDVDNSEGWWQIQSIPTYNIGGQVMQCTTCPPAIADTGSSLLYLEADAVNAYYEQVQSAAVSNSYGGWVFDCTEELPDLGIQIGSYMATLKGADLMYGKVNGNLCMGGVQQGPQDMLILGDVLLKQFFVVFHGGDLKLGIAEKN